MALRKRLLPLWLPGLVLGIGLSCGEPGLAPLQDLDSAAVIVSNPVSASAAASGSSPNSAQDGEVAYVSMPPGTLPGALTVRIRNVTTNGVPTDRISVFDGGFDPVAVLARAGDSLELTIGLERGAVTVSHLSVPVRRPPRIVRTAPSKGRTDVALSVRPQIVFSEPIDVRTLSEASVQLMVAGVPVNGTVTPVPGDELQAVFIPAAPLAQNTAYELLITTGVRDRQGDALESSDRIPFTTQAGAAQLPVQYLAFFNAPPPLPVGAQFELSVTAFGSGGNVLADRVVSWIVSNASVASVVTVSGRARPTIRVSVTAAGATRITATSEGRSAAITLIGIEEPRVSTALEIVAFSLTEFQYPWQPGQWLYAPQLRIREPAGIEGVAVVGAYFVIPGIGPTAFCTTHRVVGAGQTKEIFPEAYGDYELIFDRGGARATSGHASAILYVVDAAGGVGHIAVSVPIVPGGLPIPDTGGASQTPWSCSY